jgi:hypothetical protein
MEQFQHDFSFGILAVDDRTKYAAMAQQLRSEDLKYVRGQGSRAFHQILMTVLAFCHPGTPDDWRRYVACGICPLEHGLATNTRQLAALLGRSKSTINGGFGAIGFHSYPACGDDWQELGRKMHSSDSVAMRSWTIRRPRVAREGNSDPVVEEDSSQQLQAEPFVEDDYDWFL